MSKKKNRLSEAGVAGDANRDEPPLPVPPAHARGGFAPIPRPHLTVGPSGIVPETEQAALAEWKERLCQCLGIPEISLAAHLLQQLLTAGVLNRQDPAEVDAVLGAVAALAPKDGLEALLAVQAVVLHQHALGLMGRAATTPLSGLAEVRINLAEKLLRAFALQVRTLDAHRRQGSQTVRVEHVHVHSGGQAIVGNMQGGHRE